MFLFTQFRIINVRAIISRVDSRLDLDRLTDNPIQTLGDLQRI